MARSLPRSLADIVEQLELDQPSVVTLTDLANLARETGRDDSGELDDDRVRTVAYELQRRGWLGPLRTRNAWEFIPGARAGAYGSGDRLIELRAQLAINPEVPFVLAMDSAATLLGLAQHLPDNETIAAPSGTRIPKGLRGWRIVHITFPDTGTEERDGLPVWSLDALLAGIATRPSSYHDLAGLGQWLPTCGQRIDYQRLTECLVGAAASTTQRAIYLLGSAGRRDLAERLAEQHPPRGPVWFSTRKPGSRQDSLSKVADADLAPYLTGGTGA
jgi:hypothetical protein